MANSVSWFDFETINSFFHQKHFYTLLVLSCSHDSPPAVVQLIAAPKYPPTNFRMAISIEFKLQNACFKEISTYDTDPDLVTGY